MSSLRVLFVTPYVPSPLRTRPYGLLRALSARGHRLSLLSAASSAAEEDQARGLRDLCERIEVVRVPLARSLWSCARGLAGDEPLQASFSHTPRLEAALAAMLATGEFDVAHVEHLRAARLGLRIAGVPRVFDAVDCITALFSRAAVLAPSPASRWLARLDLERTRRFEARLLRRFEATVVTSEADRAALLELAGCGEAVDVRVVANGVDLDYFTPADTRRDGEELVFVGRMGYHANVAAAVHLVEEVMPLVWRERPSVRVTIVGAGPGRRVRRLAARDRRVAVTGSVGDVRPYLARATAAACPLVYAAGIQNKLLEAMASGTPVVASSAACDALATRPEVHLLQADGAAAFARAILRLLADPGLRQRLAAAARDYVEAHHRWPGAAAQLENLYRGLQEARPRPAAPPPGRAANAPQIAS